MTNKDDFCSKTPFNLKFKSHFLQNVGESFFHFLNSYVVYGFLYLIAIDTAIFPEIVHTITSIFSPLTIKIIKVRYIFSCIPILHKMTRSRNKYLSIAILKGFK